MYRLFAFIGCLALALFSIGQAITFSWLASFPEQADRLQSLETKFWVYAVIAIISMASAALMAVLWVKKVRQKRLLNSQETRRAVHVSDLDDAEANSLISDLQESIKRDGR